MSEELYSGEIIFGHRLKVNEPMPDLGSLIVTQINDGGVYTWGGLAEDVDKLPTDWDEMSTGSLFIPWDNTALSKAYEKTSHSWYDI